MPDAGNPAPRARPRERESRYDGGYFRCVAQGPHASVIAPHRLDPGTRGADAASVNARPGFLSRLAYRVNGVAHRTGPHLVLPRKAGEGPGRGVAGAGCRLHRSRLMQLYINAGSPRHGYQEWKS